MNIIALDQSTVNSGYSFWIDGKYVTSGCLKADGIKQMFFLIENIIEKYKPDTLVIEDIFFISSSAKSAIPLAQLQGLIISMCIKRNIDIYIVTCNKWRKILGINTYKKNRDTLKKEVKELVEQKYNIKVDSNDESDAIGIGYWYWNTNNKEECLF